MKQIGKKFLTGALLACLCAPVAASAADHDLQMKIDKLTRELEELKGMVMKAAESSKKAEESAKKAEASAKKVDEVKDSVKKVEDKSLGRWLSIGGDYRLRFDSLHGQTAAYTDAFQTFANAQKQLQGAFFADPTGGPFGPGSNAAALTGLSQFSQGMANVKTFNQANAFLAANAAMLGGLQNFAVQVPAFKPQNETLFTNRFGLDVHAKATQDVTVTARLNMYKSTGSENDAQVTGNFFGDRVGVFDGTLSHIPSSSLLNVDRAYATWSNIAGQPAWFSVGRRPSTDGAPTNLKLNNERPGNGGTPAMLINYAFDGFAIGYAPDIEALPGAYAKLCGGRGFDSGIKTPTNSVKDSDFFGVTIVPIDTDPLRVWFLWDHAFNIFDFPVMNNTVFGNTKPSTNLGDIDWVGGGAMTTIKKVGPGSLNFFTDIALSVTHPNQNVSANAGFQGLGTGAFFRPEAPKDKTGYAVWAGLRYDLPSKTKLGFEYNHGSKDWITFAPAEDDMWTSKVGTRGNVFEPYIIQELDLKPISSYLSKAFFRLGYQYYDFEYTGSNNWVGAPQKISNIKPTDMLMLAPLKNAHDVYATFEVKF
jgi:opacity protein-like surface antigen